MRKQIAVAVLLLASLAAFENKVMASEKTPNEPSSTATHYKKEELYGVWYNSLKDGNSTAIALMILHKDGTALDYLIVDDQKNLQQIVQKSSWSYSSAENLFEQTTHEVSTQNGKSAAVVSYPKEVLRGSVSLVKLGDEVIGIKLKKDDGELIGYRKGNYTMLDAMTRGL